MAIDRTAFNALVDDTGDNLTGTVLTKAVVETVLLDPMDAALALGGFGGDLNPEAHDAAILAPVNADFSWVNQGSATIRDDTSSVVLVGAAAGNVSAAVQARVKAAPATPYVITVYVTPLMTLKAYQQYGLLFRESASGALHALAVIGFGTNPYGVLAINSSKLTSPTAGAGDYLSVQPLAMGAPRWLRIADDGTDRVLSVSADGVDWLVVHTVGRTDFLTTGANQVGFFVSTVNLATPNYAPILRVSSWKET